LAMSRACRYTDGARRAVIRIAASSIFARHDAARIRIAVQPAVPWARPPFCADSDGPYDSSSRRRVR
jgi:hypothetical protein